MKFDVRLDLPYRLTLLLMTAAYSAIRSHYLPEADSERIAVRKESDAVRVNLLNYLGMAGSIATMAFILVPQLMLWSKLPLRGWSRWLGAIVGFSATGLFFWTHDTLGRYWSGSLVIKEGHELITEGPYRWVRHPMYDAVVGTSLGGFLLSANWFVGVTGLGSALVLASRITEEEAMMAEAFGEAYESYTDRTNRFVPSIKLS